MVEVSIVGLDLAKHMFQLHGADVRGRPVLRRKLRRTQMLRFFEALPPCRVAMEAGASAHHWARELRARGHAPVLIPAQFVRPFVKTNKSDAADAEAIVEAALRPTMRFAEETLAFYRLPPQHHKHLKSTNLLERLNEEIKRCTHVVRIFPNAGSCLRLIRALAVEMHEN